MKRIIAGIWNRKKTKGRELNRSCFGGGSNKEMASTSVELDPARLHLANT